MMSKEFIGLCAVAMTILSFLFYYYSITVGRTKPHVISWLAWSLTNFIVCIAQVSEGEVTGAFPSGLTGVCAVLIAVCAYNTTHKIRIYKGDWLCIVAMVCAFPLWYITDQPLWIVVILTAVDLLGFIPTFRKAHADPFSEPILFIVMMCCKHLLSTLALVNYSLTTAVFSISVGTTWFLMLALVTVRRYIIVQQRESNITARTTISS